MNNIITPRCKKTTTQQGFALLDVMVSALILAVGIIAFVKLENVSIKRSQQINYRLQATASATSLVEMLRSDRGMISWLINNNNSNMLVQAANNFAPRCVQDTNNIDITNATTWCTAGGDDISNDLFNEVRNIFSTNFQSVAGKAIMCLRSPNVNQVPTSIRVSVIWKNAVGNNFAPATVNDCPANFDDPIPNIAGVDATSPTIGYFEIYTRI